MNKTRSYLRPILGTYPKTYVNALLKLNIVGYYVEDVKYFKNKKVKLAPYLFLLVDSNGKFDEAKKKYVDIDSGRLVYSSTLETLRSSKYFVDEYKDSFETSKHVIVMEIPDRFSNAFWKFLESKYSEMYTQEDLKVLGEIQGTKMTAIAQVVLKHKEGAIRFKNLIKESFDVEISEEDITGEYDLPIKPKEEVHNFDTSSLVYEYLNSVESIKQ